MLEDNLKVRPLHAARAQDAPPCPCTASLHLRFAPAMAGSALVSKVHARHAASTAALHMLDGKQAANRPPCVRVLTWFDPGVSWSEPHLA